MYDDEEEEDYNNNDDYYEYGDGFKKGFPDRLNFVSACCFHSVQVASEDNDNDNDDNDGDDEGDDGVAPSKCPSSN